MVRRFSTVCMLAIVASPSARAEDVRWRHVATRGDTVTSGAIVRTFYKPADSATPRDPSNADTEALRPRTDSANRAIRPNLTAVIREDSPVNARANRESLEREIGVECSRLTREYSVKGDSDGRIVVVVVLRSAAEWNSLIARIRTLPGTGAHAVIVRGSVP